MDGCTTALTEALCVDFTTTFSINTAMTVVGVDCGEPVRQSVFWYWAFDPEHFIGAYDPVAPTATLTDVYPTTIGNDVITEPPAPYDWLVLCDTGAGFDVTQFEGRGIITFDSGISPLIYWVTGDIQYSTYWEYISTTNLIWLAPLESPEIGADGDATIYPSLNSDPRFVNRADLMSAYSTVPPNLDIAIYQIQLPSRSYDWIHLGPHFGNYDIPYTAERLSQLIRFAIGLLSCAPVPFPAPPPGPPALRTKDIRSQPTGNVK